MQNFQLIFLSYFIGFLFLLFIRSYDKYDKEPLGRLMLFSFFGGIFSTIVTTILYFFVHPNFTMQDAIFKVGVVEEFSKILILFLLYRFIKSEFDEIVDGVIYVAAISLGFSVIENIFYAIQANHPHILLLQRFIFATVGHISFSVYLGIAFYIHKKIKTNYSGLLLAFIFAVFAHGIYDGVLFEQKLNIFFIPIYLLLIYFQFRLLKVAYAYSLMKQNFTQKNMKLLKSNQFVYCCHCQKNVADKYDFNGIIIHICQNCNHSIIKQKSFDRILKYFRPKLKRSFFFKQLDLMQRNIVLNQHETLVYHVKKQKLNADIDDFDKWLKKENKKDLYIYAKTIEGRFFYWLGFRMLK